MNFRRRVRWTRNSVLLSPSRDWSKMIADPEGIIQQGDCILANQNKNCCHLSIVYLRQDWTYLVDWSDFSLTIIKVWLPQRVRDLLQLCLELDPEATFVPIKNANRDGLTSSNCVDSIGSIFYWYLDLSGGIKHTMYVVSWNMDPALGPKLCWIQNNNFSVRPLYRISFWNNLADLSKR